MSECCRGEPRENATCGKVQQDCRTHRTTDWVAMPAIAIASLTSSILSAVANTAGHAAASSSNGKSAAAKQTDSHKDSSDPANLANAFLACLASAVAGVPAATQAAISGTGAVSATGSTKNVKGIPTASASTPSSDQAVANAQKPQAATPLAALTIAPAATKIAPAKPLPMAATPGATVDHPAAQQTKVAIVPGLSGATVAAAKPGTAGTISTGVPAVGQPSIARQTTPAANKEQPGPTNTLPALLSIRVPTLPAASDAASIPATPTATVPAPAAIRTATVAPTDVHTDIPLSPSVGEPREFGLSPTLGAAATMKPLVKTGSAFALEPSNHDERGETRQPSATPTHALQEPAATGTIAAPAAASAPTVPSSGAAPIPPIADQLTQAIITRADVVNHEGRTDFHLRLEPPQLGTVQIHLTATDHSISARVVVAQEGTRQLIEGQADQLRQSLANAGVSLTGFDVTQNGGGSSGGGRQNPEPPMPLVLPHTASFSRPAVAVKLPTRSATNGIDILA
ncbi:MAG TPA: flagellar hook-length control protein FliK [Gemmataceae bacterium]|nr:flagellar hook-length control protein FliK [Gemmataceae bacterium]